MDVMAVGQHIRFLKEYVSEPNIVGAVAPSSQFLAAALCWPYQNHQRKCRVLEVGAGTGPITRYLGSILGPDDELDVCEIQPEFIKTLRQDILTQPDFAEAVASKRVNLLTCPVQEIEGVDKYDFVISGLPLTAFALRDVHDVFKVIRRCLKPEGVLSYFEYVGFRAMSSAFAVGSRRKRVRHVSAYLNRKIRTHQIDCKTIFRNVMPARARYFMFNGTSEL